MDNGKKNHSPFLPEIQEWLDNFPVLSETDFYPPVDNRTLHSGIQDIDNGDCFENYVSEYNELCDEEEIYDDNSFSYSSSNK